MRTEFKSINTKFLLSIAIYRADFVSKSSTNTIISIKNGIITTFTKSTIELDTYEFIVAELSILLDKSRL